MRLLRVWFSGKMSPCQGLVGSSILPTRTKNVPNFLRVKNQIVLCLPEKDL